MNSLLALKQATCAGAGIAMLPRFIVEEELASGRLVVALEGWTGPSAPVSVVYPSSRLLNVRMRAFIDLLVARFPERKLSSPAATQNESAHPSVEIFAARLPPLRLECRAAVVAQAPALASRDDQGIAATSALRVAGERLSAAAMSSISAL
jgi:LysR substrate binding domain